jgi:hypothetical protein
VDFGASLIWRRQSVENCQAPPNKIDRKREAKPNLQQLDDQFVFRHEEVLRERVSIAPKLSVSVLLKRVNSLFNRILNCRLGGSIHTAPPPAAQLENSLDGAVLFGTKSTTPKLKFRAGFFQRSEIVLCEGFLQVPE